MFCLCWSAPHSSLWRAQKVSFQSINDPKTSCSFNLHWEIHSPLLSIFRPVSSSGNRIRKPEAMTRSSVVVVSSSCVLRHRISSITFYFVLLQPHPQPWKSIFNYEWRLICRYINFMIHQIPVDDAAIEWWTRTSRCPLSSLKVKTHPIFPVRGSKRNSLL